MTDPLFAQDRASLVSQLRLTGADHTDTVAAIDAAIQTVALRFYDLLGSGQVDLIKSYSYSADPTAGDNERTRLRAAVAEEKWVRAELIRKLPILFVANEGVAMDQWNEEELTRDGKGSEDEISRLEAEGLEMVDILLGDSDGSSLSAEAIGPESTPVYRPGHSVINTDNKRLVEG